MKKHLNLEGRSFIASSLKLGMSLGEIARELGISTSTVSREIKKHRKLQHKSCYGRSLNNCAKAKDCRLSALCENNPDCVTRHCASCGKCNSFCPEFEQVVCPKLSKPPYVCNGCEDLNRCRWSKYLYISVTAESEYRTCLTESRSGFDMTEQELAYVDKIVTPLIMQGHSPYSVVFNNRDLLPCSQDTIYRLVKSCAIGARAIDLPRAVKYKPRKGCRPETKVDRNCRKGRTYEDYLKFRETNPDIAFSQMDSFEGVRGKSVLLTIELESINFMLAFVREHNNAQSVIDVFNSLYDLLPKDVYNSMFGYLLTDNGSEFSNPLAIEFVRGTVIRRSTIFYCDPSAPAQKAKVENNHILLRTVFPKGVALNEFTQQQVNLAMSHINSYKRRMFNGKSPTELFISLYGEHILSLLGQYLVPPQDIVLKPWLLKK